MDKYHIPQHLDEPFKIIIWTIDEFLLFVVPFFSFLLIFNNPVIGVILGVSMVYFLKRFKGEEGHYYLIHLAYWYLPPVIPFKTIPPSYARELLG